jgi:hypothetical protein
MGVRSMSMHTKSNHCPFQTPSAPKYQHDCGDVRTL